MDMKTILLVALVLLVLFRDELFGESAATGYARPDPGAVVPPVQPVHVVPSASTRPTNAADIAIAGINAAAGLVGAYVGSRPARAATPYAGPAWGPTEDQLFGS